MSTPIYISFYDPDDLGSEEGSFHWGLALPRPSHQNRLNGPVDIFQVVTPDEEDVENGADPDAWQTDHRAAAHPVDLTKSTSFVALVRLPPLLPSKDVVEHFLREQDAGQGDTPLVSTRDEWSCAQWVIRVLQRIDNSGWFSESPPKDLQDRDRVYERLVALTKLEWTLTIMFWWREPKKFQRRTQWSENRHLIEFVKKHGLLRAYVRFFRIYNSTLEYGRRVVRFLWKWTGLNHKYYVKKFNSDRCLDADIATTRLIRSHTSIPVPRVLFQFRAWSHRYMIMERMPGVSLDTVFPHLPVIEQARLVGQLHDYMTELRAILRPDNASSIASITGGPIFCYRLHERCDLSGPFRDEAHMNLQLRHGKPADAYPEPVPTAHALTHPLVLTHNDFASHNIMAMETASDGWRVTAIIDWECAAWMPSHWEYVKAKNFCSRSLRPHRQVWVDWLPKILEPFELEAEADRKLGRCPRKHIP